MTCLLGVLALAAAGCATTWPPEVERNLALAGDNRPELEKVLDHYRKKGDGENLEAAQFLLANMEGHGYIVTSFCDKDKNDVEFDATDYKSFQEAQEAMDALERKHGELQPRRKRFDKDLETITADLLIENIDLAFKAWHEKPWAKDLSPEAFREHILPYRGSNEPTNSTRPECLERYADLSKRMKDPTDAREAGGLILGDVGRWVGFDSLYYLHPTDQSFEEMQKSRLGRCEDISNMQLYAARANAVAAAGDYTPWWADRDNNPAWVVLLDKNGEGKAGLSNRAAKVYRKTFSMQRDSLGCLKNEEEEVPHSLAGKNFKDVTPSYRETTDVTARLTEKKPAGARFAYICVFNEGEWKPIHWGEIRADRVTFTKMGRDIAYLPAYYVDKKTVPAAPPFILASEGRVRTLDGAAKEEIQIEIATTNPATPDADTRRDIPMIVVEPSKTYELSVWDNGWKSLGKKVAASPTPSARSPVSFESVPKGRLYWLVAEGSRRLERIFTIEEGKQVMW
jgi:hypothetical protein